MYKKIFYIFIIISSALKADDWPGWFGPERDGVWHELFFFF